MPVRTLYDLEESVDVRACIARVSEEHPADISLESGLENQVIRL